jgi:hypothetical protein
LRYDDIIRYYKEKLLKHMVQNNKNDKNKRQKGPNPLETLKDVTKDVASEMRHEATQLPQDFMKELLGIQKTRKISGEISMGESIELDQLMQQREERVVEHRKRNNLERMLVEEERGRLEKKSGELKIQLKVMQDEMLALAQSTQDLAEEVQIAAVQAPVEPGVYHVIFFEKLLEFIRSFKKKINEASVWLSATNKRAAKKHSWAANYKKHGAKYLLSGEHYIARAAG